MRFHLISIKKGEDWGSFISQSIVLRLPLEGESLQNLTPKVLPRILGLLYLSWYNRTLSLLYCDKIYKTEDCGIKKMDSRKLR